MPEGIVQDPMEKYANVFVDACKGLLDSWERGEVLMRSEADLRCHLFSECLRLMKERNFERPYEISVEQNMKGKRPERARWITRLRRRFGKIDVLRCFESHEDGYCHVHAVLLFREAKFRGFRWDKFKDGKRIITYRVDQVEPFKAGWRGGFADIQLCSSVKGAFSYISKYLTKSVSNDEEGGKGVKTLALSWYFRKRSFSVSGGFAEVYGDLIIDRDNSNLFVPYVLTFDGKKIECEVSKWHLYGFVKGDHVKWARDFRKMELSEINDLEEKGLIERPERYSYG
jgi:hypothetical protein